MIPYDPLKRTLLMSLHPENVAAISLQPLDRHWLQQTFPGFSVPQAYLFLDTPAKQPLLDCLLHTPTTQQWSLDWTNRYDQIAQLLAH